MGEVVFGLLLRTPDGARSALLGVPTYALAASLICINVSMLETEAPGRIESGGLLRDRPLAAAGLLTGLLVLAGMPPLAGWPARALLWQAAREQGIGTFAIAAVGHTALI